MNEHVRRVDLMGWPFTNRVKRTPPWQPVDPIHTDPEDFPEDEEHK